MTRDLPSPFIVAWLRVVAREIRAPRYALDVAMGGGRHAAPLAAEGFITFGVDVSFESVRAAVHDARADGLTIRGWVADLEVSRLPRARFDLIVCTRYLQRDLYTSLGGALRPGGFLLYETFTVGQRRHKRGPTSPEHLLRPGELRDAFDELIVVSYEEVNEPDALARLVARRALRRANSSGGSVTRPRDDSR